MANKDPVSVATGIITKVYGESLADLGHVMRLADNFEEEAEKIVALLHEVPNASNLREADLEAMGIPLECIAALTEIWRPQIRYKAYIQNISKNILAMRVKLADLKDNMRRLDKIPESEITEETIRCQLRYKKEYADLTGILTEEKIRKESEKENVKPEYVRYKHLRERYYAPLTEKVSSILKKECVNKKFLRHHVTGRTKELSSFMQKCEKKGIRGNDPENLFTDLSGVRVVLDTIESIRALAEYIREVFKVDKEKDYFIRERGDGYRAVHIIVSLREPDAAAIEEFVRNKRVPEINGVDIHFDLLKGRKCEIQLVTGVQNEINQILHPTEYKAAGGAKGDGSVFEEMAAADAKMAEEIVKKDRIFYETFTQRSVDSIGNIQRCFDELKLSDDVSRRAEIWLGLVHTLNRIGRYTEALREAEAGAAAAKAAGGMTEAKLSVEIKRAKLQLGQKSGDENSCIEKMLRRLSDQKTLTSSEIKYFTDALMLKAQEAGTNYEKRAVLEKAVGIDPANPYAVTGLIEISKPSERQDIIAAYAEKAADRCRKLISEGRHFPQADLALSSLYMYLGQEEAACENYENIRIYCKENPDIFENKRIFDLINLIDLI